jgi:hypothetical protein
MGLFRSLERPVIPDEEPSPTAGTTFPFVPLAVGVLVLHAILAVTYPLSVLRSVLAIGAFFGMGYCVLALIVGGRVRMSAAEILAFTVGLTILVTSLSALAVSIIGIPITEFAIVILGLPIGFLTLLIRRAPAYPWRVSVDFLRRYLDFSDYSLTEKRIAALLFAGILGALVAWVGLSAVQYPSPRLSMGIGITGVDGRTDSVPTLFVRGTAQTIVVSVLGNVTPAWPANGVGSFSLRVRRAPANATGTEPFHSVPAASPLPLDAFAQYNETIMVEPNGQWMKSFSISVPPSVTPCPKPPTGPTQPCYVFRFELLGLAGNGILRSLAPIVVT